MKLLITIILLSFQSLIFSQNGNVTVKISGVENNKGLVNVGLYNEGSSFPDYDKTFMNKEVKAVKGEIEFTFKNVPEGAYAVAVWHDENENKKIDKNFIGVPKEKYGFSLNKFGTFGPPDFEDVSFILKKGENKTLEIRLK